MLGYVLDECRYLVYAVPMPNQVKGSGGTFGTSIPHNKAIMKKSSHNSKSLDSPKPVRTIPPVSEKKQALPPVEPFNMSRERLTEGASTITAVLNEILESQKRL